MKAIVLAGGLGTRLRERVPDLPKPMAPVAGRPFLEYVLDRLIAGGVNEVILSVGYQAEIIMNHFGKIYQNVAISYAIEDKPLGTGGAVVHALTGKGDEPVLVLNGDTLLNVDYSELMHWYMQAPTQVAMVLRKLQNVSRYGSVKVSGKRVVDFLEKGKCGPGLINAGVYIIQPGVFEDFGLTGVFSIEVDFLQKYCETLSPGAFLTDSYFIDIGVPDDYERAQRELPVFS